MTKLLKSLRHGGSQLSDDFEARLAGALDDFVGTCGDVAHDIHRVLRSIRARHPPRTQLDRDRGAVLAPEREFIREKKVGASSQAVPGGTPRRR